MVKHLAPYLASLLFLSACQSDVGQKPVNAKVAQHSPESIAELSSVIAKALKINRVLIDKSAFTQDDTLVIEPPQKRTLEHGIIPGRIMEKPEVFKLSLQEDQCVLRHEKSQQSWFLKSVKCQPLGKKL